MNTVRFDVTKFLFVLLLLTTLSTISYAQSTPLRGESGELILGLGPLGRSIFSTDGETVVTGSNLGAYFWETDTGNLIRFLERDGGITPITFFSDDQQMVILGETNERILINVESGEALKTFNNVISLRFIEEGTLRGCFHGMVSCFRVPEPHTNLKVHFYYGF